MNNFSKLKKVLDKFDDLFAAEDRDEKGVRQTAYEFQRVAAEIESSISGRELSVRDLNDIIHIGPLLYQIKELKRFICSGNDREIARTTKATSLFLQTGDCSYN